MIDNMHNFDFEITETTADTRTRLSNKTTAELIRFMLDIDQSIHAGFVYNIYYQEWSVGCDILRNRGFVILSPSDLKKLAEDLNI